MTTKPHPSHALTLSEYVLERNGVPLGDPKSLPNMLRRAFGAPSFAAFWQYWNPVWSYGLGRFVYTPLQNLFPRPLSALLTFTISGAIHDLATMLVRRDLAILFTPWFFLMGLCAVFSKAVNINLAHKPSWLRTLVNLMVISGTLTVTLLVKRTGALP